MSSLDALLYVALTLAVVYAATALVDTLRRDGIRRRLGEVLAEKEALEKKLLEAEERLAEARSQCEREKRELRRDYEARLREAMEENRAALSLYEAVKAGVVKMQAEGCREVLLQLDGMILCRRSELELEVLWPREPSGEG